MKVKLKIEVDIDPDTYVNTLDKISKINITGVKKFKVLNVMPFLQENELEEVTEVFSEYHIGTYPINFLVTVTPETRERGYDNDQKRVSHLKDYMPLEAAYVEIGKFNTCIYLKGISTSFNAINFKKVKYKNEQ